MSKSFYVALKNRGLVRVEGEGSRDFLLSLITNNLNAADEGGLSYACLLSPQGKFLHDFFVTAEDGAYLLDCEGGERAKDLHDRLLRYRLRAKVALSFLPEQPVYAVWDGHDGKADPRHPDLGRRSLQKPDSEEEHFAEWDSRRIALAIPNGSRDLIVERSTLSEGNFDKLNAIDFNKGCYVGQEMTARMHYRGLAKKHLYPVHLNTPLPPFTELPHGGEMRSSCGDTGLALLRDDSLDKDYNGMLKVIGK